jgi:small subunit ribosomal protein S17
MKRVQKGIVVSDKMNKAIVVSVEKVKTHPIYHKKYKVHRKFIARDLNETAKVGDVVTIEETKPLSTRIRWQLVGEKPETKKAPESGKETGAKTRRNSKPQPKAAKKEVK